jgi:hypothetical protein
VDETGHYYVSCNIERKKLRDEKAALGREMVDLKAPKKTLQEKVTSGKEMVQIAKENDEKLKKKMAILKRR